jgi:hypothetical protein
MAQVVTVRNGQVAKVLATPPDFKTMRVCVTNWDVIPSDLRPSSVAIGRIRCREASKDSGVYTAELPVPFQWGARAMFWVPDAGVNLTSNDLVVGESSLNLRFPLERFDIEVDVVPRFGGHIGFGRYHTEWMGIGISQTWCSPVAQRKSGRFLLSRTADSEPIHCQVTERHPVSGETILRGWVKLDSRTGVVPLNPGGRWVRIELGQGVERADVLLIGPVSEHDLGPAGFWYKISQARKLWIPEGTRIVQVWQEGGHRDVPAREANQRLVVSRM